ncbi:MAG: hypothetical protein JZD40_07400 [Sulfolobus sp.]|nr:hypothetical protein [Sulfolobus sp.]
MVKKLTIIVISIIVILGAFAAYELAIKPIVTNAGIPYGKFIKISNKDLAPPMCR